MSSELAERLRRMGVGRSLAGGSSVQDLSAPQARETGDASREGLPGTISTNRFGSFQLAEAFFHLEHRHGNGTLCDALQAGMEELGCMARDRRMGAFDVSRALFIDTETTGLAGGTGTVAFLVGTAGFERGGLCLRQFFMRDFDEEPAMLSALAELISRHDGFISFNGKSFDLPLLTGRYVSARLDRPDPQLPHLDLLHTARRYWRDEFDDLSLGSLERQLLGFRRIDDVPGAMIPTLYIDYLTRGRPDLMRPVFEHNQMDLLSLLILIGQAARVSRADAVRAGEMMGLGRTLEAMREPARAAKAYRGVLALSPDAALERRARKALARTLARSGDRAAALAEWQTVAERWEDLDALEALAKGAEHRQRDLTAAADYVERALQRLGSPLLRSVGSLTRRREAFRARQSRLRQKLSQSAGEVERPGR